MTPALASICSYLEVEIVDNRQSRSRRPGQTCAQGTIEAILRDHGSGHLIIVIRSIMESENNKMELVAPVIWAVSDIILAHPEWVATGLKWLTAMDSVDLSDMHNRARANRRAALPRQAIATMLFEKLRTAFDEETQGRLL